MMKGGEWRAKRPHPSLFQREREEGVRDAVALAKAQAVRWGGRGGVKLRTSCCSRSLKRARLLLGGADAKRVALWGSLSRSGGMGRESENCIGNIAGKLARRGEFRANWKKKLDILLFGILWPSAGTER